MTMTQYQISGLKVYNDQSVFSVVTKWLPAICIRNVTSTNNPSHVFVRILLFGYFFVMGQFCWLVFFAWPDYRGWLHWTLDRKVKIIRVIIFVIHYFVNDCLLVCEVFGSILYSLVERSSQGWRLLLNHLWLEPVCSYYYDYVNRTYIIWYMHACYRYLLMRGVRSIMWGRA